MSVRFVIGRAGTGKSRFCLQSVRKQLAVSALHGPRLILLVPEQASLMTERALLEQCDRRSAHRAEVLSFRRLAHHVRNEIGDDRRVLSSNGRAMVLRHLLGRLRPRLRYYRKVERFSGFIDRLGATLAEFLDQAVTPDTLETLPSTEVNPQQTHKLHDLHLVYAAYLEYLGEDTLDPSQFLDVARRHLGRCGWLRGAEVFVDGFAGYTRQEALTLAALAQAGAGLHVTALLDPADADDPRGAADEMPRFRLFGRILRNVRDLQAVFAANGVELDEPLVLRPKTPPRFASSQVLAALERRLFAAGSAANVKAPVDPAPTTRADTVRLIEAADRRVEVDYAVSIVSELVRRRDRPLRYRDIALIVRDLAPYHDLISAALTARQIPFFIDRRRRVAHHPLVELLRALLAMVTDDFSTESVRLALKTDLLGLDRRDADEFENFLIATGYEGAERWFGPDWTRRAVRGRGRRSDEQSVEERSREERINRTRERIIRLIDPWYRVASTSAGADGKCWAKALLAVLDELGVPQRLHEWAEDAQEDGDLDAAEEHRQIWRDTVALLDDLYEALADQVLDVEGLASVLHAALAQFTLGLAPPMLDQVLVGAVERSRHPDLKAAIILGFNEGVFPAPATESTVLNDDDRAFLHDHAVPTRPNRRIQTLSEPLLAYTALTRASETLVVCYPRADSEGKALAPSVYVTALCEALPDLQVERVESAFQSRATWGLRSTADLAAHLAAELRGRPALPDDATAERARWNAIYQQVRERGEWQRPLRAALSALGKDPTATLDTESVRALVPQAPTFSVSRLEAFAACPFKHFAAHHLGLRRREEARLAEMDFGTLHHAVLETFFGGLIVAGRALGELSDDEIAHRLDAAVRDLELAAPGPDDLAAARDAYLVRRSAAELARAVHAQRRTAQAGRFTPRRTELRFGSQDGCVIEGVPLDTPQGRRVYLHGVIDRVDLAEIGDEMLGVVIDYKRGHDYRLDLSEVYYGLSLQLLAYLVALERSGASLAGRPIRPAGAFFVSLRPQYAKVDHPDDADAKKLRDPHRPRGVLDADAIGHLDNAYAGSGASQLYSFFRKKDGALGHMNNTDGAGRGDFDALRRHVCTEMGALADRILDGEIAVAPFRLNRASPCGWCDYRSVCRFEFGAGPMRMLPAMSRTEVLDKVSERTRAS